MSDAIQNPYPQRFINPNEPDLLAAYTMGEGELAQFGRYLNRATLGGAAYDLTTRAGTPGVGQAGGIYVVDNSNSYWQGAVIPVGDTNFSYAVTYEMHVAPGGARYFLGNLNHYMYALAGGAVRISTNAGVTTTDSTFPIDGRGPLRIGMLYDGTDQILVMNGIEDNRTAAVPTVPAAGFRIGRQGEVLGTKVYSARRTVAQERFNYVQEFAKRVLYHWHPSIVGEGPAGGIPTGAVGEGDWSCPSGGATLGFAWVNDLSVPGGGFLALTDSGALSMRRLDFMVPKRPMFGSWLVRYRHRNPTFGNDNPYFGLIRCRGDDMTVAGSESMWVQGRDTGGGFWRTETSRENAGLIGVDVDHASVAAGTDEAFMLTHHVDGNWRIYSWNNSLRSWFWRAAAVVNDVTFLSHSYFSIAPRGSYIRSVTCFQGEMTPHELEMVLP